MIHDEQCRADPSRQGALAGSIRSAAPPQTIQEPATRELELEFPLIDWDSKDPVEVFNAWLSHTLVIGTRQFRATSRETYQAMFNVWRQYLESIEIPLTAAQPEHASAFFAQHGLEPVSRRRYLQLLDRLYRFLRQGQPIGTNPMGPELRQEGILPEAFPQILTPDRIAALRATLGEHLGWRGARDRAVAALLIGAGLRVNELIALTWADVGSDYRIRVEPSGVHPTHVTRVLPEWQAWLPLPPGHGRILFPPPPGTGTWEGREIKVCPATRGGRAYTPSGLFRRVTGWLPEVAGVPCCPNVLRNTFAHQALQDHPVPDVQEFMGHAEIRRTLKYVGAQQAA